MDATYSALGAADAGGAAEPPPYSLLGGLQAALATIPANLGQALGNWGDPLGLDLGNLNDAHAAAERQSVKSGTFGAMAARFDGAAGAFAYLLFILLYAPCTAAVAAIWRESSPGWTLFAVGWTTGLGYAIATIFYQGAIFARNPASSAAWITAMVGLFIAAVVLMRVLADRASPGRGLDPGQPLIKGV